MTPSLSEKCSNRLSYSPKLKYINKRERKKAVKFVFGCTPTSLPFSQKGGDPAAPSGTTTLLRLHPPHKAYLRQRPPLRVRLPASGTLYSDGVTGGVYKARERIHRIVLICDYQRFQLHEVGFQTSIRTTIAFLRFAPHHCFASLCFNHCSTCVALDIRAMMT